MGERTDGERRGAVKWFLIPNTNGITDAISRGVNGDDEAINTHTW